jgi:hypothetical protein
MNGGTDGWMKEAPVKKETVTDTHSQRTFTYLT